MVQSCSAYGCKNRYDKDKPVSFHKWVTGVLRGRGDRGARAGGGGARRVAARDLEEAGRALGAADGPGRRGRGPTAARPRGCASPWPRVPGARAASLLAELPRWLRLRAFALAQKPLAALPISVPSRAVAMARREDLELGTHRGRRTGFGPRCGCLEGCRAAEC